MRPLRMAFRRVVAFDLLRDALSAIFGLSELKRANEGLGSLSADTSPLPYHQASLLTIIRRRREAEEDPADYPANEGDNSDDESSDDDNDDNDVEKDEEDEEEEEHLAPADPSAVPTNDPIPSS
ncbi:hypothetical protein Tco_0738645 [Tanacetum coccineum]